MMSQKTAYRSNDRSRWAHSSVELRQCDELVGTVGDVHVLEGVEDGALLVGFNIDLRINAPVFDHCLFHTTPNQELSKHVLANRHLKPVRTLCQAFEGRCRSMHAI